MESAKEGLSFVKDSFSTLSALMPVVTKVHGSRHRELKDVNRLVSQLEVGINGKADSKELLITLNQLRQTTNGYAIPSDACEGFKKEYRLLSKIDETIRTAVK